MPTSILLKPGKLDEEEWAIIRKHPTYGRELLEDTFMQVAGPIVEQHHERSDGSGYPFGLAGDEILVESSIVAVADTFDASRGVVSRGATAVSGIGSVSPRCLSRALAKRVHRDVQEGARARGGPWRTARALE